MGNEKQQKVRPIGLFSPDAVTVKIKQKIKQRSLCSLSAIITHIHDVVTKPTCQMRCLRVSTGQYSTLADGTT